MKIKSQCVTVRLCNSYALKDKKNPLCTFSIWPLSPALNISIFWCEWSKRNKRDRFDQSFIAFHNLRRSCQFPYKSAFYSPENCISLTAGFFMTLARHHMCPLLPPSLSPLFPCSELCRAVFLSALVICISSSIFLCSNVVAEVCSVQAVTMTCPQRTLLWAALVTLHFHLLPCQIVFTHDGPCPSDVLSL